MRSRVHVLVMVIFCAVMLSGCGGSSGDDVATRKMTDAEKTALLQVQGKSRGKN